MQVLGMELQIHFSLMQPQCQISKKQYGKSKPCNNLSMELRAQTAMLHSHVAQSTLVRNSIINIHFDDLHRNALPGIPVPQLMFDLFDKVHHLCPYTSFCQRLVNKSKRACNLQWKDRTNSKKLYYLSYKHIKRCIESIFRMFLS